MVIYIHTCVPQLPIVSLSRLPTLVLNHEMHPPLTLHKHPACAQIIEEFVKCHDDHPVAKFFGECTNLKIKLDRCFREEKETKRKANFERSKQVQERLKSQRASKRAMQTPESLGNEGG